MDAGTYLSKDADDEDELQLLIDVLQSKGLCHDRA